MVVVVMVVVVVVALAVAAAAIGVGEGGEDEEEDQHQQQELVVDVTTEEEESHQVPSLHGHVFSGHSDICTVAARRAVGMTVAPSDGRPFALRGREAGEGLPKLLAEPLPRETVEEEVEGVVGVVEVVEDGADQVVLCLLKGGAGEPVVALHHDDDGHGADEDEEGRGNQQQHAGQLCFFVRHLAGLVTGTPCRCGHGVRRLRLEGARGSNLVEAARWWSLHDNRWKAALTSLCVIFSTIWWWYW